MANIKNPLLSLAASGTISKAITYLKRRGKNVAEITPTVPDQETPAQLSWRHMYQKCSALWHTLSAAEKQDWEALGTARHMTGFAYWQSQCLKPNPGIYLPLQGGTMQGDIIMAKNRLLALPLPTEDQEAASKKYHDDNLPPGGYTEGAKVYHSTNQTIPDATGTILAFDSEEYDTDEIHSTVAFNSRLTCKTAGVYVIWLSWAWSANPVIWSIHPRLNGVTAISLYNAVADIRQGNTSAIYKLAVNDFLEFRVWQNSGGALDIQGGTPVSPGFAMQRIG